MMLKLRQFGLFCVLGLALVAAAACNRYEVDKANKLVDAANVSIKEVSDKADSVTSRTEQMDAGVESVEDEDGLTKLRTDAKAIIADCEKVRDNLTDASNKFFEAGKLKLNDKYKEYLDTKGQEMKKRSEMFGALIGIPQALIDSPNREQYHQKSIEVKTKYESLQKEADDLGSKASKIYEENKSLFRQS